MYSLAAGNDAAQFLEKAVRFLNESVWGTLSCTLIVHSQVQKNAAMAVEEAIAELRYGGIALNAWTSSLFSIDACTWGAYPGEELDNVASGIGIVRNAFLLDNVEKSVLRSPFRHVAQLVLNKEGMLPLSGRQFDALSDVMVKPNLKTGIMVGWHMAFSSND